MHNSTTRWRVRLSVIAVSASTVVTTTTHPVLAYCASKANYYHSSTVWHTTSVPSGWGSAIQASASAWNGKANWTFRYVPYGQYGPYYGAVYRKSFRSAGHPDIPGLTQHYFDSAGRPVNQSMYLNSDFTWNLSGTLSQQYRKVDVRTIVTHELGHFFILVHPNQCSGTYTSTEVNAVMTPNWRNKWTPNSDDIAGLKALHGGTTTSVATDLTPDLSPEDILTDAPADVPADVEPAL